MLLGAIAARTTRIRLNSGVTVLSVLDPVRVAEDYATIDQLSGGRLDLTIGKGNEVAQFPLFGLDIDDQWELLAEKYELLRTLWREEDVTWPGSEFTRPLTGVTTLPRPFAGAPRVWHGSATTLFSAGLAARFGDPLFSANAIQPLENYGVLVDHYRSEYARHGHDPAGAFVAAGSGALFIADTTQEAIREYGPVYNAIVAATNVPGNNTPFRDIEHAVAEGPALVGTPQQVIDKIARFHGRLGARPAVDQPADDGAVRAAARDPRALRRRGGAGAAARVPDGAVDGCRPSRAAHPGAGRRLTPATSHRRESRPHVSDWRPTLRSQSNIGAIDFQRRPNSALPNEWPCSVMSDPYRSRAGTTGSERRRTVERARAEACVPRCTPRSGAPGQE